MLKVRALKVVKYFIISIVVLIALFPFYMMLIMGTYSTPDLYKGLVILPGNYLSENFKTLMSSDFLRYLFNSIYISTFSTVLAAFSSAMAGFAFAKYNFKGKNFLYSFILATMMIPAGLGLIAFLQEMRVLGWTNTHFPLIIPSMANAFGVYFMASYMKDGIPKEVIESARIDGCNEFRIFLQIALPFIRAAFTAILLLNFIWSWNNYLLPLVLLSKDKLYTIPLGISNLGTIYRADIGARILALSLGTLPLILIFVTNSKAFLRGLTVGAIKG